MPKDEDDLIEIGSTGLKHSGGVINDEWLAQLKGSRGIRTYAEMRDNDAVIGAVLYAIESLIRQVEWTVRPADDSDAAQAAAEFLESCVKDMATDWESFISEILSMLVFGFAPFEIVYKIRSGSTADDTAESDFSDGRIGWRKFAIRGQDTIVRWEFDDDGTDEGLVQRVPPNFTEAIIPAEKLLLFKTRSERGSPQGRSMLRNAFRSWYFLKRLQEIEAIGVERDLAGLPVLQVPPELMTSKATGPQKALRANLESMIQQIPRDEREGVLMPSELDREGKPTGFKLTLLSTGGSRAMDTDKIIRRYESRIAMSVLAEFILLGSDSHGSFALASSKTALFATALRSTLEGIAAVLNGQAVKRLFALNPEFPSELIPRFDYGDIEDRPLDELSGFLQSMTGAGLITPDAGIEEKLREAAGLPAIDLESAGFGPVSEGEDAPAFAPAEVDAANPKAAFNGAQTAALQAIISQVIAGEMPKATAAAAIAVAFPLSSDEAKALIDTIPAAAIGKPESA